jgi:hypothetical protein
MGNVAAAVYGQAMTSSALLVRSDASPVARMLRQTVIDSGYLLVAFPLAVASFVVLVTGLSLGVGVFFVLGLPLLIATLYVARGFAELERLRIRPVLRTPVARPGTGRRRRTPVPSAACSSPPPTASTGWTCCTAWWCSAYRR